MFRVINSSRNGMIVAEEVARASTLFARMKGLLGRAELAPGHGLWIDKCNSIHTFFMRFPIDAVFVSSERTVVRTYEDLKPFRLTPVVFNARAVLELPARTLRTCAVSVGDQLVLEARP